MQLQISGSLYGRKEELVQLQAVRQKASQVKAPTQIALVHGASGVGKSSLCETLRNTNRASLRAGQLFFCSGKVDQYVNKHTSSAPFAALIQALDSLAGQLKWNHEINECLECEAAILKRVVPNFEKLAAQQPEEEKDHEAGDTDASNETLIRTPDRLKVGLRHFLRDFCSHDRLVVLYIDDLQWSDEGTLNVLTSVLNDATIHNLFFIGGYRDDDEAAVQAIQPFLDTICNVKHRSKDDVCDMSLGNLDLDSTRQLVCEVLACGDDARIEALSELVFRRTGGNPFFVLAFLKTLHARGMLVCNYATAKWQFDVSTIKMGTDASDNVVAMVTERIRLLPPEAIRILVLAACLGFSFQMELLKTVSTLQLDEYLGGTDSKNNPGKEQPKAQVDSGKEQEENFLLNLKTAEQEGFVELNGGMCCFTHDRVQQSLYELLPIGDALDRLHWKIGERILEHYKSNKETEYFLQAVDQLNLGSEVLSTDEYSDKDRMLLIDLNLQAASLATKMTGCQAVSDFLDHALDLSTPDDWKTSYDTLLQCYSHSAEVEFSRGQLEKSVSRAAEVQAHSRSKADQVRCRIVRMEIFGMKRQFKEALREARSILEVLGEKLPRASYFGFLLEMRKARAELLGKDEDFFLNLEQMTSPQQTLIITVLAKASVYAHSYDPLLALILYTRATRDTAKHGFCIISSPFALAGYGMALARIGDMQGAIRYAELAMKRVPTKNAYSAVAVNVGGSVGHLGTPSALWLEPLLKAYRAGLETGELLYGGLAMGCYSMLYFFCGLPLEPLYFDMQKFSGQLKLTHQYYGLSYLVAIQQLACNLTGMNDDPLDYSRELLKQSESWSDELFLDENDQASLILENLKLFSAYLLRDWDAVEKIMDGSLKRKVRRTRVIYYMNHFFDLLDGLVGFALWRRHGSMGLKYRSLAMASLKSVHCSCKQQLFNCDGIYSLLRAERASVQLKNNVDSTRPLFDDAIMKFSKSGFTHMAAMACEAAGEHMIRCKDQFWADHYLNQAALLFNEYGAVAKVNQLTTVYTFVKQQSNQKIGTAIQGKEHYDSVVDAITKPASEKLQPRSKRSRMFKSNSV